MKILAISVLCALICTIAQAKDASCVQAEGERYIRASEAAWANSVATNDVGEPRHFLSDSFVGVSISGKAYDKAEALSETGLSEFASDALDYAHIHFYGMTAVVQGSKRWEKKSGASGHFVWIDTWICNKGEWQVASAADVNVPDKK
jgi:hypothetical protein